MKRILIAIVIVASMSGSRIAAQSGYALYQQALSKEQAEGKLTKAIAIYERIVKEFASDRALAAKALLRLGECHQKLGGAQARKIYERLLSDFGDQRLAVAEARARLSALQTSPALKTATLAARQIWAGEGVDGGGTVSPDGHSLSFTDWATGDLAIRDLTTGTNRRLTNTGGWVVSGDYAAESVISPDGQQVAYAWFVQKDFRNELRILSIADSTRPKIVLRTERKDYLRPFGWSPDGRQLFVVRSFPDRTNQIGTVSVQDGSFRNIKSLDWRNAWEIDLSPDGRHIAYAIEAGDNGSPRDIMILSADGSGETAAVQSPANDRAPFWSPEGRQLLFVSDRTGNPSLWRVTIQDGRPQGAPALLKTDVGTINPLGMTKSGQLVYFATGRSRRNIYSVTLDGLRAAASPVLATESFVNANFGPAWSRDGEYLAYYSVRTAYPVLVIRSTKTGDERTVPLPTGLLMWFDNGPKWFPDNRSVLVVSADAQGAGQGFYRLALDTGKTELLWHVSQGETGGISSYDLSPDGKTIFCVLQHAMFGKLLRFDIDSKRETELKKNEWFITVAASPDGASIAYLKSIRTTLGSGTNKATEAPAAVEIIPAAGGAAREVFRAPIWFSGARYNTLGWSPDSRFVLFLQDDGALWKVPAVGGSAEQMGISMKARIKSPAIHPDGKRIVFAAIDADNNEVWILENFLPPAATSSRSARK